MSGRRTVLTGGVIAATVGLWVLAAQSGPAGSQRAMWGSITDYADAVAIDSPFREERNKFWDGRSGEGPLTDQSKVKGMTYAPTHPHTASLEELSGSTTVVVGVINSSKSYFSHDRTTIYSEMTATVSQVLRDRSGVGLAANSQIAVERAGGAIRLGRGRLLSRGCPDESIPHGFGKYLLVLGYSGPASSMFPILGAYALVGDQVFMLDSVEPTQIAGRRASSAVRIGYFLTQYGLPTSDFLEVVEKVLQTAK